MLYEKTILIADDESRTRRGIRKTLEMWSQGKLKLIDFDNGIEALAYLRENEVDLIITDIRMPGVSGLNMIDTLRSQNIQTSTIIISGYAEFDYAKKALELKVTAYLLKPIEKDKLIEEVMKAFAAEDTRNRYQKLDQIVDRNLVRIEANKPYLTTPIEQILRFIDDHYAESIGLKEAAEYVHMNASYLSALFKDQMGMTFSEYLTRFRIQKAKELLVSTTQSINEISEQVGYLTAKYFIKVFKELEGISPSGYRRQVSDNH